MIGKNQLILIVLAVAVLLSLGAVVFVQMNNSAPAAIQGQDSSEKASAAKESDNSDTPSDAGGQPDVMAEEEAENSGSQVPPAGGGNGSNSVTIPENNSPNNSTPVTNTPPANTGGNNSNVNNNNNGITAGGSVSTKKTVCSDGTSAGRCSQNKPSYCDNQGRLMAECSQCGCPSGLKCTELGDCLPANQSSGKCRDGTIIGKCSATKPKLCVDTEIDLADACHSCGCPSGKTCGNDSKCH